MEKGPPRLAANYSILLDTNSYRKKPYVPAGSKLNLQCLLLGPSAFLLTILDVRLLHGPRGFSDVGAVRRRIVLKAARGNCFLASRLSQAKHSLCICGGCSDSLEKALDGLVQGADDHRRSMRLRERPFRQATSSQLRLAFGLRRSCDTLKFYNIGT